MESICSGSGCDGKPKKRCSCDPSLQFCEKHSHKHFSEPGAHNLSSFIAEKDLSASTKISKEMRTLSSTISKVMKTGKSMFEEVSRKICEITEQLTDRQDTLISIASNLDSDNQQSEAFTGLGDLGIKFKSCEEFKKMLDDYFSKESVSVDFSIFNQDIKNILNHIQTSNKVLEEVKKQSKNDKQSREDFKKKLKEIEKSSEFNEKKNQEFFLEREKKFATCAKMTELEKRVENLEKQVKSGNISIEELKKSHGYLNYILNSQFSEKIDAIEENSNDLDQQISFNKKSIDDLNKKIAAFDKELAEKNTIIERQKKIIEDFYHRQSVYEKTIDGFSRKLDSQETQINVHFIRFFDKIDKKIAKVASIFDTPHIQESPQEERPHIAPLTTVNISTISSRIPSSVGLFQGIGSRQVIQRIRPAQESQADHYSRNFPAIGEPAKKSKDIWSHLDDKLEKLFDNLLGLFNRFKYEIHERLQEFRPETISSTIDVQRINHGLRLPAERQLVM